MLLITYFTTDRLLLSTFVLSEREKGRVFQPGDTCPNTVQPVLEVLRLKHPTARPPKMSILEAYIDKPPSMLPVEITDVTVSSVMRWMLGAAGAVGGGFGQSKTLSSTVWGDKHGDQAYFRVIRGLDGQRPPTLGGLQGTDVGAPRRPWQLPWCKSS